MERKRTFHVGILTKDEKVPDALIREFEGIKDKKSVAIIDLAGMGSELFKKFVNNAGLDIVVTAEDTFTEAELREKADEIVKKGRNTYFTIMYDDENAAKMLEEAQRLAENEIVITLAKIENERDYRIGLATNVQGQINRKIQNERRAAAFVSELSERLKDEE